VNFKQFFLKEWPPKTEEGKIPHYCKKISNKFTQYLEYILQKYCKQKGSYLLREIRYDKKDSGKMDYLICNKKELNNYWNGKDAAKISADVCIEAQWDKNKFTNDFVETDFPKLCRFKSKLKVAIAGVPSREFEIYVNQLYKKCKNDSKSDYLIWLFFYNKREREIIWQTSHNFKKTLNVNKGYLSV
jgi:hypothetical protein